MTFYSSLDNTDMSEYEQEINTGLSVHFILSVQVSKFIVECKCKELYTICINTNSQPASNPNKHTYATTHACTHSLTHSTYTPFSVSTLLRDVYTQI